MTIFINIQHCTHIHAPGIGATFYKYQSSCLQILASMFKQRPVHQWCIFNFSIPSALISLHQIEVGGQNSLFLISFWTELFDCEHGQESLRSANSHSFSGWRVKGRVSAGNRQLSAVKPKKRGTSKSIVNITQGKEDGESFEIIYVNRYRSLCG